MLYGDTPKDSAKILQNQTEFRRQQAVFTVLMLRVKPKFLQNEERNPNQESPLENKTKQKMKMKTRHSRTQKQMEHASICFSRKKKKEFLMEALKQV